MESTNSWLGGHASSGLNSDCRISTCCWRVRYVFKYMLAIGKTTGYSNAFESELSVLSSPEELHGQPPKIKAIITIPNECRERNIILVDLWQRVWMHGEYHSALPSVFLYFYFSPIDYVLSNDVLFSLKTSIHWSTAVTETKEVSGTLRCGHPPQDGVRWIQRSMAADKIEILSNVRRMTTVRYESPLDGLTDKWKLSAERRCGTCRAWYATTHMYYFFEKCLELGKLPLRWFKLYFNMLHLFLKLHTTMQKITNLRFVERTLSIASGSAEIINLVLKGNDRLFSEGISVLIP